MSMLEIVQFENNKYGLRNTWTGIILQKEYRTAWGANRARRRNVNRLSKAIRRLP